MAPFVARSLVPIIILILEACGAPVPPHPSRNFEAVVDLEEVTTTEDSKATVYHVLNSFNLTEM